MLETGRRGRMVSIDFSIANVVTRYGRKIEARYLTGVQGWKRRALTAHRVELLCG